MHYRTSSSEETKLLGERLAKEFFGSQKIKKSAAANTKKSGAAVIALQGDLGAGKTTFVQGFLRGMGVRRRAPSPTFIIMRRYRAKKSGMDLFHMDAYRLKGAEQLGVLEWDKIIADPRNVVLVEWAERIKDAIPRGARWIKFAYDKKEGVRKISFK